MSFDWKEYLNLAKYIHDKQGSDFSSEASYRCAVSRAYYSAFCYALNHAVDFLGYSKSSTPQDDHGKLKAYFKQKRRNDIAIALDQLRQWRNLCDYENNVASLPDLVAGAFIKAEKIINSLATSE